jgi:hypothetical protein
VNNYVVHLTPLTGLIASVRIAQFISKMLKIPVISNPIECDAALELGNIGTVIVVNGPPAFCRFREEVAHLVCQAENWVWAQNDYTIYPPSQVNKYARMKKMVGKNDSFRYKYLWTAIPGRMDDAPEGTIASPINWNALTMQAPALWGRGRKGFVYYGAFRGNRATRFKQFLPPKSVVSAPGRGAEHFSEIDQTFVLRPPFDDVVQELRKFEATVLIHDARTDRKFEYPPNRFYEGLSAGVCMFVSPQMSERLNQAGYEVRSNWIVMDEAQIRKIMKMKGVVKKIAEAQRKEWAANAIGERASLVGTLRKLYREI